MGKLRTRVNNKGKRWKKGQSSNSNPETKIYRDSAWKISTTIPTTNDGTLTVGNLNKHDEMDLSEAGIEVNDKNTDNYKEEDALSIWSIDSYASNWSACTNATFSSFLKRFDHKSAHHKEMLAILAAVRDVIKENGGSETVTEYYATLLTTLDSFKNEGDGDSSISAILSLLKIGTKSVSKSVLQSKFSIVSKILMEFFQIYALSENNIILTCIIDCLSRLLRAQELAVWAEPSTISMYDGILSFVVHSKPKVRKAAQHAVVAILQASDVVKFAREINPSATHPVALHTGKHCLRTLEDSCSTGGNVAITTVLHELALLKNIIACFPKQQIKECCEMVIRLFTLKKPLVTQCGLEVIHSLLMAKPAPSFLPATLNSHLIAALFDYQPPTHQPESLAKWFSTVSQAYINLSRMEPIDSISRLQTLFSSYQCILSSGHDQMIKTTTASTKRVIEECIGPVIRMATEGDSDLHPSVKKRFEDLRSLLKLQYSSSWGHILYLISVFYMNASDKCSVFMVPSLLKFSEMRDDENFAHKNQIERVFRSAIHSFGPVMIISQVPFQIVKINETNFDIKRSWLISLIKNNSNRATLKGFVTHFLPIAESCKEKCEVSKKLSNTAAQVTYELLYVQVWDLFPTFCANPPDIAITFPTIAKALGDILNTRHDIRSSVLGGLRNVIKKAKENENDLQVMMKYAKNYLPILFNLYTNDPSKTFGKAMYASTLETIEVYLSIAEDKLKDELFGTALDKLNDEKPKSHFMKTLLDLVRVIIPYQSATTLDNFFQTYTSAKITKPKDFKEEKKYYRLVECICASKADACVEFVKSNLYKIVDLLENTATSASAPSHGPRLRILYHLMSYDLDKEHILKFVTEVISRCKDINKKCRQSAFQLITRMAQRMLSFDALTEFMDDILLGFKGDTKMICSTLLALVAIVYRHFDEIFPEQRDMIIENVLILVTSATREISGAALAFIKSLIVAHNEEIISNHLSSMIRALSKMTADCKRKHRQRLRDIYERLMRKYDANLIISMVPTEDALTMARLKALRKLSERKKRNAQLTADEKESKKNSNDERKVTSNTIQDILADLDINEESDENSDDDFTEKRENPVKREKKKKVGGVYLTEDPEDIVDFTDPSSQHKISLKNPKEVASSKPKDKKKRKLEEFKISEDGRLIITDNDTTKVDAVSNTRQPQTDDQNEDEESVSEEPNFKKRKTNSEAAFYKAGGKGIHRPIRGKRSNNNDKTDSQSGERYKSKKAKGDMKRKGMPEPYAYVALKRNSFKRKQKKIVPKKNGKGMKK